MTSNDPQHYYAQPGPLTTLPDDPAVAALLAHLPQTLPELVAALHGAMIHIFWAQAYGLELSDQRKTEVQLRSAARMLRRMAEIDPAPLGTPRAPNEKLVGNCRDFSVMLCTLLRSQGVPARPRCGFGAYFMPDHYEDHWICEVWDPAAGRWKQVDAQLDALQREKLHIGFDTLDVPRDQFLPGGRGWQLCRDEGADPDKFGIFDMHGWWFIRGNLVRDAAALNKVELLPWDGWGLIEGEDGTIAPGDLAFLDHVAALTLAGDESFAELRALYDSDARLRVPPAFRSYGPLGPVEIRMADLVERQAAR